MKDHRHRGQGTGGRSQSARRAGGAFTLIELLVVVVIISILAALGLSTLGYVNKKGAESRARSEVAALSAALESYKLEVGNYPASNNLYTELTGQGPVNTNRVFFEPTPGMVTNNKFIDPWSEDYVYSNFTNFFEIYSKAGDAANSNNWIRN